MSHLLISRLQKYNHEIPLDPNR